MQGIPVSVVDPTTGQILQYDLATRQYVPVDYVGKAGGTFTGNLTLNGTANVAPNQTAASGSSLMTRDLVDDTCFGVRGRQGYGTFGSASTALGPIGFTARPDASYGFAWGTDNTLLTFLPFFIPRGKTFQNVTLSHLTGTHPTAVIEVAFYSPDSVGRPGAFIQKTSFPLSAAGVKTAAFAAPISVSGLVWGGIRISIGDTSFKAGGNGVGATIRGYANALAQNVWLQQMFGSDIAGQLTQYGGTMGFANYPISAGLLPTTDQANLTPIQIGGIASPYFLIY